MKRVAMFLNDAFRVDSRVEREARALVAIGYEVEVIALLDGKVAPVERRDGYLIERVSADTRLVRLARRLARFRLPGPLRGLAERLHWLLRWRIYLRRAFRSAKREPADIYIAHDVDTLPAGVRAKRRLGRPLIYDAHELYADMAGVKPRPECLRRAWIRYEGGLIRQADAVFAVTESRAREMERRFGPPRPKVLRNVPESSPAGADVQDLRQRLGIPGDRRIVLYLGGMQPNRGLEPLVAALTLVPRCALAILGEGDPAYVQSLREAAIARGLERDLFIGEPVRPHEVVAAARSADVGVILNPNVSLNNYLSLPNKIFEYAGAGVPVVASDFPDMANLLRKYEFGLTCDPEDPADIARAIRSVIDDPDEHAALCARAAAAGRELTWENESEVFLSEVRMLGSEVHGA